MKGISQIIMEHINITFAILTKEFEKAMVIIRKMESSDVDFSASLHGINEKVDQCIDLAIKSETHDEEGPFSDDKIFFPEGAFEDANFWSKTRGLFEGYLFASVFYFRWGQHLHNTQREEEAVSYLARSVLSAGVWIGATQKQEWAELMVFEKEMRKEYATKGGDALAEKYVPIKAELVRLLRTSEEAWESQDAAIATVVGDLWIFIKKRNDEIARKNIKLVKNKQKNLVDLKEISLAETIRGWLKNDAAVKTAFFAAVKTKNE